MREILFGWLTKGQFEVSALDTIILTAEFFLVFLLFCAVVACIDKIKEKRAKRKDEKNKEIKPCPFCGGINHNAQPTGRRRKRQSQFGTGGQKNERNTVSRQACR